MKVEVEVPDDVIVREGVLVVSGWLENGSTFWRAFPVEGASQIQMSDMCRRAHLYLEGQIARQKKL